MNWGFGGVLFLFFQIDYSHWTERKIIFSTKQDSKFNYETGSLKKILFFPFLVFEFQILVKWELCPVCFVVNQNVTTWPWQSYLVMRMKGVWNNLCLSESLSFPSTAQMCHLFCHGSSWAIEAAVAIERNGNGTRPRIMRQDSHSYVTVDCQCMGFLEGCTRNW